MKGVDQYIDFTHEDWRYQAVCQTVNGVTKMRLWFRQSGEKWELGHSKVLPSDMDQVDALALVRSFIRGEIDHEKYNAAFEVS